MKNATGSKPVLGADGIWRFRLTLHGERSMMALPLAASLASAIKRRDIITALAKRMGHLDRDKALDALTDVAKAPAGVDLNGFCKFCEDLIGGWKPPRASGAMTLMQFHVWWNIGRPLPNGNGKCALLQDEKPDVCERRSDSTRKAQARSLVKYAIRLAGDIPVDMIDLELSNRIRDSVPSRLRSNVRRQYLSPFKVALDICVRLGLMSASPLPPEWLPADEGSRDLQWIYPREDLKMMRCRAVPLCWRVFFGYLARNGSRELETCLMTIGHFDLEVGGAYLEEWMTKTTSRRWRLSRTDSWIGLAVWVAMERADVDPTMARMFINEDGEPINPKTIKLPDLARKYLRLAGVTRRELFVTTLTSRQFVVHDYRASCITTKACQGWTNFEIRECTGHETDSEMERYRRVAQSFADLDRGDFTPLHEAIPELAEYMAAHPECVPPAALPRSSHPLARHPANPSESLASPRSMVESVLGSQVPDMAKIPQNPPPSLPSSPVQPGVDAHSMAFQLMVQAISDAVTERVTAGILTKLVDAGVLARPRPALVVKAPLGDGFGDDDLKKR